MHPIPPSDMDDDGTAPSDENEGSYGKATDSKFLLRFT